MRNHSSVSVSDPFEGSIKSLIAVWGKQINRMQTFTLCHCVKWLSWIRWAIKLIYWWEWVSDEYFSIYVWVYAWTGSKVLMDSQDVEDHAHRPHVHLRAVGISPQDLWSCKQRSLLDSRWLTEALTESFWNPTENTPQGTPYCPLAYITATQVNKHIYYWYYTYYSNIYRHHPECQLPYRHHFNFPHTSKCCSLAVTTPPSPAAVPCRITEIKGPTLCWSVWVFLKHDVLLWERHHPVILCLVLKIWCLNRNPLWMVLHVQYYREQHCSRFWGCTN